MADDEKDPRKDGTALPDDWQQRTIDALNKLIPNSGVCPRCTKQAVTIAPDVVTPANWTDGGGLTIGGPSYPQAMLVCTECGHTAYFNLIALRVLEPSGADAGADNE